ncbi:hypothetical protein CP532_1652 [Ophiocordyceps camponoti-leonardi (nom. inval.)]|nr:hypothetical protein CP532_1652 [Ophiocordyceps camponoti-leonardi (nom. inval.)]
MLSKKFYQQRPRGSAPFAVTGGHVLAALDTAQQAQNPFLRVRGDTALGGPRSIAETSSSSVIIMAGDDVQEGLAERIHQKLRAHGIKPPAWPSAPGATENHQEMSRFRELYDAYRHKVRAALTKEGLIDDPDKRKRLSDAIEFKGICEEMCPEYEMITRISEHDVNRPERDAQTGVVLVQKMVKKLARSAAGQEAPLPMDVRSALTLRRTLDYLIDVVLRQDSNLSSVHPFLWDRTRAIRRDFAFFSSMSEVEVRSQVYVLENITRFHVTSLHLLSRGTKKEDTFVEQQELEQLGKTLLSLRDVYDDCNEQGIACEHEAEFRAYFVLFHGRDSGILETLQRQWRPSLWQDSDEIRTAVSLVEALQNTQEFIGSRKDGHTGPLLAASGPNMAYFGIVEDPKVSYTMACFAECHFQHLRRSLLATVKRSLARPKSPIEDVTAADLNEFLRFDTVEQAIEFARLHNLDFAPDQHFPTDVSRQLLVLNDRAPLPHLRLEHQFSQSLVEKKRGSASLPDVIHATIFEGVNDGQSISNGVDGYHSSFQDEQRDLFVQDEHRSLFVQDPHYNPFASHRPETEVRLHNGLKEKNTPDEDAAKGTSEAGPSKAKGTALKHSAFLLESGTATDDAARCLLLGPENYLAKMSLDTEEDAQDAAASQQKRPTCDALASGSDSTKGGAAKLPTLEEIRSKEKSHFLRGMPRKTIFTPTDASAPAKPNPFAAPLQLPPQLKSGPGASKPNPFAPNPGSASAPTQVNNPFAAPVQPSTGSAFMGSAASNAPSQKWHNPFAPAPQVTEVRDADSSGTRPNPFASLNGPDAGVAAAATTSSTVPPSSSKPSELAVPAASSSAASSHVFGLGAETSGQMSSAQNPSPFAAQANNQNEQVSLPIEPAAASSVPSMTLPGLPQAVPVQKLSQAVPVQQLSNPAVQEPEHQNSAGFVPRERPAPVDAAEAQAPPQSATKPPSPHPASEAQLRSGEPRLEPAPASPAPAPAPSAVEKVSDAPGVDPSAEETKKTRDEWLAGFTNWYVKGDNGLMSDFLVNTIKNITENAYEMFQREEEERKAREEREILEARGQQYRKYNIALKTVYHWRRIARERSLAKVARAGRDAMREHILERLKAKRDAAIKARLENEQRQEKTVQEFRQLLNSKREAREALLASGVLSGVSGEREAAERIVPDDSVASDIAEPSVPTRKPKKQSKSAPKEASEVNPRTETAARGQRVTNFQRMMASKTSKNSPKTDEATREQPTTNLRRSTSSMFGQESPKTEKASRGHPAVRPSTSSKTSKDSLKMEKASRGHPAMRPLTSSKIRKDSPNPDMAPGAKRATNFSRSMSSSRTPPRQNSNPISPYWKLKAMGIVPLPDGTAVPEFMAPEMKQRFRRLPSVEEIRERRIAAVAAMDAALEGTAEARAKFRAEYKSPLCLSKRKRTGEDDVDDGSKRRATAGEEASSALQSSTSTSNKRRRSSLSGAVDDDDDGGSDRESIQQAISTTQEMCAELRAMRAELEEGTAWYRAENEKMLSEMGRGREEGSE